MPFGRGTPFLMTCCRRSIRHRKRSQRPANAIRKLVLGHYRKLAPQMTQNTDVLTTLNLIANTLAMQTEILEKQNETLEQIAVFFDDNPSGGETVLSELRSINSRLDRLEKWVSLSIQPRQTVD